MRLLERTFISTLAIVLGVGSVRAHAAAESTAPAQRAGDSMNSSATQGLAEVVVTAQRRQENLQKAPIPVAVVGGEALSSAGVVNAAQLSTLVPALQVVNTNGAYSNFYIRGVGNFTGNALTESAIAFNYDGVYLARPSSTVGFFYDLERVEVLKGPQGSLYGRNATGGAINVIPQAPTLETGGYGRAEFGNHGTVNFEGAVNLPLSEKVALRVAGIYNHHDGYMKDGTSDAKDSGGRLQLRVDPTDAVSIVLAADYFHQGGNGVGGTPVRLGVRNRYGAFAAESNAFYTTLLHVVGGTAFDPLPNIQFHYNSYWGVNARMVYRSGIGSFTIIPAYRHSKLDYTTGNIGFFIMQKETFRQHTIEARYESPEDRPFHVLIGGYYFRERGKDPYNIINNQYGFVDQKNQRYGSTSPATFARLTYDVTKDFHLTGGIRYTHERRTYGGQTLALTRVCLTGFLQCQGQAIAFPNSTVDPPVTVLADSTVVPDFTSFGAFPFQVGQFGRFIEVDKSKSFNKVTWRLGADWNVTPGNLLYASYETGFKSGGFFATIDSGVYRPETIRALTIGSKNRFLDDKLQLNLEAFYWRYKDQQISHLGVDSTGTLVFPTENVGRSTLKGAEAEIEYLATPTTLVSADLQYLSAEYKSFVYRTPAQAGPPQSGCVISPNPTGFNVDCTGRRPPQAPKWAMNIGLSQTFDLPNGARLVFEGRAHHQTGTRTSLEYLPEEYQKSYWQGDLQGTYHDPSDRLTIGGFVNNVTNTTVKGQTFLVTYSLVPTAYATLRPPRTYGVRLGYEF